MMQTNGKLITGGPKAREQLC